MEYLLKVQKAIAQTQKDDLTLDDEYFQGWIEAGDDLIYGCNLGETAVKECLDRWRELPDDEWDSSWQGYYNRMNEIYKLII